MQARSYPLGVHPSLSGDGSANVAVYAPGIDELELVYQRPGGTWRRHRLKGHNHGIHYGTVPLPLHGDGEVERAEMLDVDVCPAMPEGTRYGFVPFSTTAKRTPDPSREQILLDPYGRGLTRVSPPPTVMNPGPDAYGGKYVSQVVAQNYHWENPGRPSIPWRDTIIYEAHAKGLTMLHPDLPEEVRGTYAGLAHPVILKYLQDLGITAIELLPVHAHLDEPHLTKNGLSNYWGYNTLSFFTPHFGYATRAAQDAGPTAVLNEFKHAVDALHGAGIQVFLDVVYNHTAEGGSEEPAYSWRGLGDRQYYRHDTHGNYVDVTGCGNSVNFADPQVVRMALDSLRYWVTECHIDGFRFDLAPELGRDENHHFTRNHPFFVAVAADPVLQGIRMISEPWDVGAGGWQTGRFPTGWADWNDTYRDTVRNFWLSGQRTMARGGGGGNAARLAGVISGSADMFAPDGRTTLASVNFVTAHDGFTMYDLTAYDGKHNQANLENNADGTNDNHSWNHGEEGVSDNVARRTARAKTVRNMMATLLVSQGVPMITAGDELLRSQGGNNNAYCQDNRISWVDWKLTPWRRSMLKTTRRLIAIRKTFLASQPSHFPARPEDVLLYWYGPDGHAMTPELWQTDGSRVVQVVLGSCGGELAGTFVINGSNDPVIVTLPGVEDLSTPATCAAGYPVTRGSYELVLATDFELDERAGAEFSGGDECRVPAQSIAMFSLA
ncbi:glycogen debranching protein GlgX [Kocuria carniphila]|uniref:glycogen debranching protein GlgX n=1 Tax=Kocuria carniphila TaxID=262208 RepID=UPI0021A4942B|nr:glycogen debranching protein GlgX [Kocuria carniphila]MCT1803436.1 glycogen debranching protein GlgX [Kocuria carniphila]